MAEPVLLPSPAPAVEPSPDKPETTNDFKLQAPAPVETEIAKTVDSAASRVFEKFGVLWKRGRGRPRSDGLPAAGDVRLGPAPPGGVAVPMSAPGLVPAVPDPYAAGLFRRAFTQALKGTLGIVKSIERWLAEKAGIDGGFTERALKECEPDPTALEDWRESAEALLKKHGWSPENRAEEWAFALNTFRIFAPHAQLVVLFRQEIARRRAEGTIPEKK